MCRVSRVRRIRWYKKIYFCVLYFCGRIIYDTVRAVHTRAKISVLFHVLVLWLKKKIHRLKCSTWNNLPQYRWRLFHYTLSHIVLWYPVPPILKPQEPILLVTFLFVVSYVKSTQLSSFFLLLCPVNKPSSGFLIIRVLEEDIINWYVWRVF